MTSFSDKPGAALAEQLIKQSEADAAATPMDAVLDAACAGRFTDDRYFRLLARLWTLKRTMYYVYGGWAQGINLNEYPPAVAYLFGKQTYDESTQEMQFCDEMLRRGLVPHATTTVRTSLWAIRHRNAHRRLYLLPAGTGQLSAEHSHRRAQSRPQSHRTRLDREIRGDASGQTMHAIFHSQLAETRSHILMGRFQVERYVTKDVDAELAKRLCAETRRDYLFFLEETARFVLGLEEEKAGEVTVQADID